MNKLKNLLIIVLIIAIIINSIQTLIKIGITLVLIQTLSSVLGSISVAIAVITYFNNKVKDNRAAAIDQVSFFRKEVLTAHDDFVFYVREKQGESYLFSRVRLDNPQAKYTRENFIEESKNQISILKIPGVLSKQTSILNMIEEISLKIKHFGTFDHEALNSIKIPFVELVETHAIVLLSQREIFSGIPTYSTILEIYDKWKDLVDRRKPEERQTELMSRINIV